MILLGRSLHQQHHQLFVISTCCLADLYPIVYSWTYSPAFQFLIGDPQLTRMKWRCLTSGQPGHLARDCLGRDETMPSSEASEPRPQPCHYLITCWAHQTAAPPKLSVKVEGRDTEALLDSGSSINLVRPEYAGRSGGEPVTVSYIHGDTWRYPTTEVRLQTPQGQCQVRARIVKGLPVPVLLGRDCALFQRYWMERPLAEEPGPRRRRWSSRGPDPEPSAETPPPPLGPIWCIDPCQGIAATRTAPTAWLASRPERWTGIRS